MIIMGTHLNIFTSLFICITSLDNVHTCNKLVASSLLCVTEVLHWYHKDQSHRFHSSVQSKTEAHFDSIGFVFCILYI